MNIRCGINTVRPNDAIRSGMTLCSTFVSNPMDILTYIADNPNMKIEMSDDATMEEMVDRARRVWAEANIQDGESYYNFAARIGVSYRTVLRWLGRLNGTKRLVKRALTMAPTAALDATSLPLPIVWSRDELAVYRGPLVYVVMKEGVPLYVGCSKNGAMRILSLRGQHDRHEVIAGASHVYLYRCDNKRQASALEAGLIRQYKPLFNVNGVS